MRLTLLSILLATAYAGVFAVNRETPGPHALARRDRPKVRIGTTVLPADMKGGKKRWVDYEEGVTHGKRRLPRNH